MDTLLADVRFALRGLLRAPGFTLAAVLALGLGIGGSSAIFSVVDGVLLRPLPYPNADGLVRVFVNFPPQDLSRLSMSPPELADLRTQTRSFAEMGGWYDGDTALTGVDRPVRLRAGGASASLFRVLGVRPAMGRLFTEAEEPSGKDGVALLSYGLWRARFGADPGVVGQHITLDGQPVEVIGVLPEGFDVGVAHDLWTPLGLNPQQLSEQQRGSRFLRGLARLKPGVTAVQAQRELDQLSETIRSSHPAYNPSPRSWVVTVVPLRDLILGSAREALLLLFAAVGLLLLIACANVANLLLARAASRQREFALRAALGAGRARIIRQLLTESLLLGLLGGTAGLALAAWGVDALVAAAPQGLPRVDQIHLDLRATLFTLGLSLSSAALFGLVPALHASRTDLSDALKEGGLAGSSARTGRLRATLVIAETALALLLLVSAGLMGRSFLTLLRVDPGFDPARVLTAEVTLTGSKYREGAAAAAWYAEAERRAAAMPGVVAVGSTSVLPLGGRNDRSFEIEGIARGDREPAPDAEVRAVTPGYFRALSVPVLRGRGFADADDAQAPLVALVSEGAARKFFRGRDPIGMRLRWSNPESPLRTIVGVVHDVREAGLDSDSAPTLYLPEAQFQQAGMTLAVRCAKDPSLLIGPLREALQSIDPEQPLGLVQPMDMLFSASVGPRRFPLQLLLLFGAIALTLSAIGIYGVISYSVSQRTREIGVRMAVGARAADVQRLVVGQGLRLAGAGVLCGVVGALALTRLMGSLLYGVSPSDPLTYATVALLLLAVALLATWLPARRATAVDPIIALRAD